MLRAVFVNHWSLSCWSLLVTRNSHGVPFQQKHLDICLYEATMGSHERFFGCSRPQPPAWSTRVCFRLEWSCVDHIAPARCIKAFVGSQSHCDRNETLSTPTYYFIAQNIRHLESLEHDWGCLNMSEYDMMNTNACMVQWEIQHGKTCHKSSRFICWFLKPRRWEGAGFCPNTRSMSRV